MAEPSRRTGFAATVGLGVASAALASVASAKPWFRLGDHRPATAVVPAAQTSIDMPLALALSLVVLAGWGAMLVSRGVLRRVFLAAAFLAALGVVACAARAPFVLPDDLRHGLGLAHDDAGVVPTGWFFSAAVAAVLSVVVAAQGWRAAPSWPTMSSRYDAPASRPAPADETDLWKALDAGEDPTDPEPGAGPTAP